MTSSTGLALAVFWRDMPAAGASLRRVRCWNEFEPLRGFVLQLGNQQSPALAADLAVEAPFLRDIDAWPFTGTATETCTQQQHQLDHRQPTEKRAAASPTSAKAGGFHAATQMISAGDDAVGAPPAAQRRGGRSDEEEQRA